LDSRRFLPMEEAPALPALPQVFGLVRFSGG